MKSLPFDQSVLQEIASPFLEYPSDPCVQTVGRSQVFFFTLCNVFVYPWWANIKKKKSNFLLLNFFFLFAFCLQTTLQQIYNILLNWCRHIDKCNTASLLGGIHGISASCCTLLKPLKYKLCFALSQECLDIISVIWKKCINLVLLDSNLLLSLTFLDTRNIHYRYLFNQSG